MEIHNIELESNAASNQLIPDEDCRRILCIRIPSCNLNYPSVLFECWQHMICFAKTKFYDLCKFFLRSEVL